MVEQQTVISIRNVSKNFKIFKDKPLTMKEKLLRLRSNEYNLFYALKDVNLDITKGETVGLIGHNGCGKSTLLKLITKILYPDQGEVNVKGRISSLIELGAGFHPDFTGRENIYINASIFGLSRKEIDKKLDEIISFAELGEFIDNPVRTYSSGMYMRLAFSVAINVEPEILLIDEILSVGDSNFQKKCFERIEGFKRNGATIVIVAHDLGTLEKICDRLVWMNQGEVMQVGEADRVINSYSQYMNKKFIEREENDYRAQTNDAKQDTVEPEGIDNHVVNVEIKSEIDAQFSEDIRWGSKDVLIERVQIINHLGESINVVEAGKPLSIEISYKVIKPQKEYIFGMGIYNEDKVLVYGNNTQIDKLKLHSINSSGIMKFCIDECMLLSGTYTLNVAIVDGNHLALDFIKYYMDFKVVSNDKSVGLLSIDHKWELT